MKLLVFSLAILLILECGDALECSHCVSSKPGGSCVPSMETCVDGKDVCISVDFLTYPYSHFRRCAKRDDCDQLELNAFIKVHCCGTDNCNA